MWIWIVTLALGLRGVLCMQIRMENAAYGVVGGSVKLWCSFSSLYPISEHVSVDWSYRVPDGGPTVTLLHYQSEAYPILDGPFKDRVQWEGNVKSGDASISLSDLRLTDNGTLYCTVRNPPDVHGNVPQTKLTVTLESIHFKFSTAILLSALVFIPSALVSLVLLIRMNKAIKRRRSRTQKWRKSPIEECRDCRCGDNAAIQDHQSTPGCLARCYQCGEYDDD
ncbi:myelin protein zero-like protein 3 [Spea bombifrons]|uniref:myelin protein zero-like protein 3 n=1 Tax=Spea bombifrons TaxID=233779 RepID=UPI00234B07DF|nr:myelin protein zero-like protein 3 [Spea bombifrons]